MAMSQRQEREQEIIRLIIDRIKSLNFNKDDENRLLRKINRNRGLILNDYITHQPKNDFDEHIFAEGTVKFFISDLENELGRKLHYHQSPILSYDPLHRHPHDFHFTNTEDLQEELLPSSPLSPKFERKKEEKKPVPQPRQPQPQQMDQQTDPAPNNKPSMKETAFKDFMTYLFSCCGKGKKYGGVEIGITKLDERKKVLLETLDQLMERIVRIEGLPEAMVNIMYNATKDEEMRRIKRMIANTNLRIREIDEQIEKLYRDNIRYTRGKAKYGGVGITQLDEQKKELLEEQKLVEGNIKYVEGLLTHARRNQHIEEIRESIQELREQKRRLRDINKKISAIDIKIEKIYKGED